MVDFTDFQTRRKAYDGANGNKLSIIGEESVKVERVCPAIWPETNSTE